MCSTDHYHYLAWKTLADRLSIPFNETDNNRLRGVSRMERLNIILEKAPGLTRKKRRPSWQRRKTTHTKSCCTR